MRSRAFADTGSGQPATPDSTCERADLVRLGFVLTGSREQAEDLAQDAFAALAAHAGRGGDPLDDMHAYLRRVVLNQAAQYHRRRIRLRRVTTVRDVVLPAEVDETLAAVSRLPAAQRQAVVLRFYLDWPLATIAAELNRPIGTVKSDLSRAMTRLRKELSE